MNPSFHIKQDQIQHSHILIDFVNVSEITILWVLYTLVKTKLFGACIATVNLARSFVFYLIPQLIMKASYLLNAAIVALLKRIDEIFNTELDHV
jgi:membrane-bound metal-dependent hydrolase YbcI (DUF457 family)